MVPVSLLEQILPRERDVKFQHSCHTDSTVSNMNIYLQHCIHKSQQISRQIAKFNITWLSGDRGGAHRCKHRLNIASFPGLHAQLLSLAVRKAGGRPGRSRHVIRAAIDVTACLLELMTQGVRPPYVPISARPDDNGRRQSLEASYRSRIREQWITRSSCSEKARGCVLSSVDLYRVAILAS